MKGQYITLAADSGEHFQAYLATSIDGHGPGVVLCQEIFGVNAAMREVADHLAQEGYTVLVPDLYWRQEPGVDLGYTEADFQRAFALYQAFDEALGVRDIAASLRHLRSMEACSADGLGVVGYCLGGKLAYLAACRLPEVACAVGYYGVGIENALHELEGLTGRLVLHFAEQDQFCQADARETIIRALHQKPGTEAYVYPGVDHAFARPASDHYHKPSALLAHERSIAALRRTIGPDYNLSALWDEHVRHEFATRDVPATMATMVPQPYVNHIPTMTGGVGYREPGAVLPLPLRAWQPEGHGTDADLAHCRCVADRRRVHHELHPRSGNRLDAAGRGTHRAVCRDPDVRCGQVPRAEALPRTYLLGPGQRTGANRLARP